MRISSSIPFLLVAAAVVFAACSSDVTTDQPHTSGSGGAGSTSTATATTTATSGTTSTTSATSSDASTTVGATSSSTGGNTACDELCAKVQGECNLGDLCGMNGFDCSNPQLECPSQCLLDAPCSDVEAILNQQAPSPPTLQCLQACQGGSSSSSSTGSGGPQECAQCTFQSCTAPLQACGNDASCQAWFGCIKNCGQQGPSCYTDCNNQFPGAAQGYQPVYDCLCQSCDDACNTTIDPCDQGAPLGGGAGGAMP